MPNKKGLIETGRSAAAGALARDGSGGLSGTAGGAAAPIIQEMLLDFLSHSWEQVARYSYGSERGFDGVAQKLTKSLAGQELLLRDAARFRDACEVQPRGSGAYSSEVLSGLWMSRLGRCRFGCLTGR